MFVKKISIKAVLIAFRGAVGLKRLATFLVAVLRRPFAVAWAAALCPLFTVVYRAYRAVRKAWCATVGPFMGFMRGILTGRSAATAVIVALVSMVTAGNIYASPPDPTGMTPVRASILANLSPDHTEQELVVEDAFEFSTDYVETSYLDGQAVGAYSHVEVDPAEDVLVETEPGADLVQSHISNAIRALPDVEPVSGQAAPTTRTHIVEYTVQEGESIGSIAQKFGLKTTTILWENDLSSRSIIKPGQTLRILPVDGISYKVKSGDTALALANKYKTDVEKLLDVNGLTDPSQLQIGEKLVLPDAAPPPPPPAPRPATIANIFVPPAAAEDDGAPMLWPTAVRRITQYYSWQHTGVDIAGPMRTPIYAAESGTVIFSGWNSGGYGNMTIIDHGNGLYTRYAHATRNLTQKGDTVNRGDVIALMGSTGRSTGPHLHFEVLVGGIYNRVNPFNYVR